MQKKPPKVLTLRTKVKNSALKRALDLAHKHLGEIEKVITGSHTIAVIGSTKVLKTPIKIGVHGSQSTFVASISDLQNLLAKQVKGIPTNVIVDSATVLEDKAPGKMMSEHKNLTTEQKNFVEAERSRILSEIIKLGYIRSDTGENNTIYCPDSQTVTLIDWESLKKL